MSIDLITELPIGYTFFCAVLGTVYAVLLYYKSPNINELSPKSRTLLGIIRGALITVISFFLLTPLLKTLVTEKEKPIIIVAVDNSESINFGLDSLNLDNIDKKITTFSTNISEKFDVEYISFGDNVSSEQALQKGKYTNFTNLFEYIENNYANRNVGSVVIASDGIYNQGSNPLYLSKRLSLPIYTIGLGDTTQHKDAGIAKVASNKLTYLGNKFPVEISVNANKYKGEQLLLSIKKGSELIASESVEINTDNFYTKIDFLIEAVLVGNQKYTATIEPLNDEITLNNNSIDFYIDVIESRQRILFLADAPHPDMSAIRRAISSKDNYHVDVEYFDGFEGDLSTYNLVIIQQMSAKSKVYAQQVLKELNDKKIATLFLLSPQTDISLFNSINSLISINNNNRKSTIEVLANVNSNFNLFTTSNLLKSFVTNVPPLEMAFAKSYTSKTKSEALLHQKIGNINTEKPLMLFGNNEGLKSGVLMGSGLWKWRLYDFNKNGNHNAFDELIQKTIQYLCVKEDKSKFKIISKNVFNENDIVSFKAELYNNAYELITDSEVDIVITNEKDKEYYYSFSANGNVYSLSAGVFEVGTYTYKSTVIRNDEKHTRVGQFTVQSIKIEALNTVADFDLLKQLANNNDGEFVTIKELNKIEASIANRNDISTISYSYDELEDLIKIKWIFYLILILLGVEWFIRKRNGAY